MDFESPDVEKEFPGLYASDPSRQSQERETDASDGEHDKPSKKELLIGRRKEKKESKKDKGYVAFEGESSEEEMDSEQRSPSKSKKGKSAFKFSKKDKSKDKDKLKDKEAKEEKKEKKETKEDKKERKESKEEKKEKKEVKEEKKDKKVKLKLKDRKKSKHLDEDHDKEEKAIFGIPLQAAVERNKSHDGIQLPIIVRECIDYIEEHGLSCEGIYRLSGVKSKIQKLKNQYNNGEQVFLYEHEPHIVASLLKLYIRELPEPVLTNVLMPQFEEIASKKDETKCAEKLKRLIDELPVCNRLLLSWIFVHMGHIIQREKQNKMNVQNVSVVLSPTMQISHRVLNTLFIHSKYLFGDTQLKKYIPPLKPETSRFSLELPDSPSAIEEELAKQESKLSQLHAEINAGLVDAEKEELLWEVQRVVTQLKRKLRVAKRSQDIKIDEKQLCKTDSEEIDLRLQTGSVNQVQPAGTAAVATTTATITSTAASAQVEKEHKCKVYVPWEGENKQENQSQSPTKVIQEANTSKDINTVGVTEKTEATNVIAQESNPTQVVSMVEVIPTEENVIPVNSAEESGYSYHMEADTELQQLLQEKVLLSLQEDEMVQLGSELKRKIETERCEVERLKAKIMELQNFYCYKRLSGANSSENFSDTNSSDSDDDDDFDDDEDEYVQQILDDVIHENKQLEWKNMELISMIQQEREACLAAKIEIRLTQQLNDTSKFYRESTII